MIDTAAHIRRARHSTPAERILRRPYSYHDPSQPDAEQSGLVFVAFQRDVSTQFVPVQQRLADLDLLQPVDDTDRLSGVPRAAGRTRRVSTWRRRCSPDAVVGIVTLR